MKKHIPSNKILIALQYWDGDKGQALNLARLLADIEPSHTELADFLFVCRFDSSHNSETIRHVSRKFNTFSYRSPRRGTGWPCGCNELFFGTMEWFYHKSAAGQIPGYKAIMTIEADGIPMQKNWIEQISTDWNKFSPAPCMAGAWLENGPHGVGHINGNAMMTGDLKFLNWLVKRVGGVDAKVGWDYILAKDFCDWGWKKYDRMKSVWRTPIDEKIFLAEKDSGTLWYHGVKGNAGIDIARKHLV